MGVEKVRKPEDVVKKPHVFRDGKYVEVPLQTSEYPKWKYHALKEPVLVDGPQQEARLGAGWQDLPIPIEKSDWKTSAAKNLGNVVTERHVEFLQSEGFGIRDITQAEAFVAKLSEPQKQQFFEDAAKFTPKAQQKPAEPAQQSQAPRKSA